MHSALDLCNSLCIWYRVSWQKRKREREHRITEARRALLHAALCLDDPFYGEPKDALLMAATAVMHLTHLDGVTDQAHDWMVNYMEQRRGKDLTDITGA